MKRPGDPRPLSSPYLALALLACLASGMPMEAQTAAGKRGSAPTLTLTTEVGFLSGGAKEYVYDSGYKMSELDWSSSPLALWGLVAEFRPAEGLFARFELASGMGGRTGSMTDSDWQNYDGILTNFSGSESWTDRALKASFSAGYAFRLLDSLRIGPLVELDYLDFQWSARNGALQYPVEIYPGTAYGPYTPISANTPKVAFYGIGIVYQQSSFLPCLGFQVDFRPSPELSLLGTLVASPLGIMSVTDNHVARGIVFTATMGKGIALGPRLDIGLRLSNALGLVLRADYLNLWNLGGNLTQTDSGGKTATNQGGAGASFEALDMGLALLVRL